jgi:uncharacterized protein
MDRVGKTILALVLLVVVVVGGFLMLGSGTPMEDGSSITAEMNGGVQTVVLSMKDYNYWPQTVIVKEGIPVEITLDSSVVGCLRSFTIRDFGVNQYAKTPQEVIRFTPTMTGTFRFACSMNMGFGTLEVV